MRMADKLQGEVTKDIVQPLMMRSLYSIRRFVFSRSCRKRVIAYESKNDFKAKNHEDAIVVLKVKADGQEKKSYYCDLRENRRG
jgi:hypothetical protein